jgi:SulP family sulfate permease
MKVQQPVHELMKSTGFYDQLGPDHFLGEEEAVPYLFYKVLDPATCIYECEVRAFAECQNLPKRTYPVELPLHTEIPPGSIAEITPQELRQEFLNGDTPPLVIDVRESREFKQGHIPQAQLTPLPQILSNASDLPCEREIILVCRTGRRSTKAALMLQSNGCHNLRILRGGMLAWQSAGFLEAIDYDNLS